MNPDLPLVSVIITTKNEEKHIGNCLESIKNQNYLSRRSFATLPRKGPKVLGGLRDPQF